MEIIYFGQVLVRQLLQSLLDGDVNVDIALTSLPNVTTSTPVTATIVDNFISKSPIGVMGGNSRDIPLLVPFVVEAMNKGDELQSPPKRSCGELVIYGRVYVGFMPFNCN